MATTSPAHARSSTPLVAVVLRVPAAVGGRHAELLAEFVSWAPLPMDRAPDGSHVIELQLEPGRRWRYLFAIDGDEIINDPTADEFVEWGPGYVSAMRT